MLDYWERKMKLIRTGAEKQEQIIEELSEHVRLASLVEESIVDGPGMRFVVFTQGCPHRCPGCHNPQTHLSLGGMDLSIQTILSRYEEHPGCRGITLSGGEPFLQAGPLANLAQEIHQRQGDVVVYTGYRLEHLRELAKTDDGIFALLAETDLLIDGPYVQEKRCLEVPFVGSLNQRLIAMSSQGNQLLSDIPILPDAPSVERLRFKARVRRSRVLWPPVNARRHP